MYCFNKIMIAGIILKRRGCLYNLTGCCLVSQIVRILQNMTTKYRFQIVLFIPALSLIAVGLYNVFAIPAVLSSQAARSSHTSVWFVSFSIS